jgi:hypothetical protein
MEPIMSEKATSRLAWVLCGLAVIGATAQLVSWTTRISARPDLFGLVEALGWGMAIPIVFAVLGALIVARQGGNRVGWLMMIVALASANPVSILMDRLLSAPPETLSLGLWLLLWLDGWSWIPLIFPIFLIPLHFPTGRPPSRRWNWVIWLAVGMWLFLAVFGSFSDTLVPTSGGDWSLPNPIGFIPIEVWNGPLMIIWGIGLLTMVSASVVSLFMRYRRAQTVEREQIKWLLFAGAFFVVVYGLTFFLSSAEDPWLDNNGLTNLLLVLSILAFPAAITIAIFRYRLYDIDVVIRKTLLYSALTALLALVYFGSVILLQRLFGALTGIEQSPLAVVVSTLVIAALFASLRRRIQDGIDRRFFRRKYNAQQVLARFAITARDETDLDALLAELVRVVDETLQPEHVSVWLCKPEVTKASDAPRRHG